MILFLTAGGLPGSSLSRSSSVWSGLSQLMYCEESRAARVTLVTVLVVSLTWTPHLAILTMSEPPAWLHHLTVATITSYSVISPVIFAFRSRRVQRELRKVFGIRQEVQTRPLNFFLLFALFALKIIAEFFTSLLSQKLSEKDKMLSKLKSLSCPHLVLTSCQSIQAGPGMTSPEMSAWRTLTSLKSRQLQLSLPQYCSETDTGSRQIEKNEI